MLPRVDIGQKVGQWGRLLKAFSLLLTVVEHLLSAVSAHELSILFLCSDKTSAALAAGTCSASLRAW